MLGDGPVHIALFGCGLWGRNILRDLHALGCRVTLVEPDARARDAAPRDEHTTVLAAWDDRAVDGVIVATPASTHREVVIDALRYGVPVFCEKPLATSTADAAAMLRAGEDRLFVMHTWRYHPGILALAELAASGELGPVTGLRTTRTNWVSPRTDVDATWTLVPHDLSIALAVLGAIPVPRHALVESSDGRPVGMLASLGEDPWFVLETSTRYRDRRREVRLHLREGVAVLPHAESRAIEIATGRSSGEPALELRAFDPEPALHRQLRSFVAHLRGGPPPPTTAAEGLAVVSAVEALRRLAGVA